MVDKSILMVIYGNDNKGSTTKRKSSDFPVQITLLGKDIVSTYMKI